MLILYNTMARKKVRFKPREDLRVKMFTCGPSIYRRPHLGNYRTFLYEDILLRYLEYKGYRVNRVINFTDVEDKIISEAEERNIDIKKLADQIAGIFLKESDLLGIKLPECIPRSSTTVDQAVRLIKALVGRGYAYWQDGDVFFDPLKFEGFGKLFRLDMSKWPRKKIRFRRDTYPGRRWNRGDFILWHGRKKGEPVYWNTEIGQGRPAWNIQDPAIITKHLGYEVDINCGGIDNLWRHHDYNIAVIESLSGQEYASFYLHGEHLFVDGKPMSKSRGNILYPNDIIGSAYDAPHLRFFLIYTHYRRKLNFTEKSFHRTCEYLDCFRKLVEKLTGRSAMEQDGSLPALIDRIPEAFERHMDDDLNVGQAFEAVCGLLRNIEEKAGPSGLSAPMSERLEQRLRSIDTVLGVLY